ncbi:MAG: threonine ammonia-lyase, partial [Alphaproteobacteria bacterium]
MIVPTSALPTVEDVKAAAGRIAAAAYRTPLIENTALNAATGGRVLLKLETLQRTGSFKFRGAYNKLVQLTPGQRRAGVVAYSSGNHAQGVSAAARVIGVPSVIVMPADAPTIKIERTRANGAEIVYFDRANDDREAMAQAIATERGMTLVPPFDDPDIIAGQGTVGLELVEQARALDAASLDAVLVCCGGGGLTAGCALAVKDGMPDTRMIIAEPEGFDDTHRSIVAGRRVSNSPGGSSICDALLSPMPGELTLAINSRLVDDGVQADDEAVLRAI